MFRQTALSLSILSALLNTTPSAADPTVAVAILDTGLRADWATHPEFEGTTLRAWRDFADEAPSPVDLNGHGTAVASLAVGATLGVEPEADLIVGRVIGASGGLEDWATLTDAIDWAVAAGADVINVSLWSPELQLDANRSVAAAIARAREAGVLTVWIAGNGFDVPSSPHPSMALVGGSAPGALIVGSSDADGEPSTWSRPGADLLAWGEDVTVARAHGTALYASGLSGTSYAAPRIAGAIAALIIDGHARDPDALAWVILHESQDRPEVSYAREGYGWFGPASLEHARAVASGERENPGPDERDVFHTVSTVARAGLSTGP